MSLWRKLELKWAEHQKRVRREIVLRSIAAEREMLDEVHELIEKYPPPKRITIALEDIPMEERRRLRLPLD